MKKRRVRINDKIGTVLPASWGNDWIYVGNCHREDFFNFIRFDHDKLYRETLTDQQEEILLRWFPTISLRDASEPAPVASDTDLRAENERLREIVDLFCNAHTDTSGDPNLYILLMETAHDKATALNPSEPKT